VQFVHWVLSNLHLAWAEAEHHIADFHPFTKSFNSKIRTAYRNGHGYSFEVLRAKILFSDALQKRVRVAEQVKVKRKPRFEEVSFSRVYMMEMMVTEPEPEYDIRTVARMSKLGTGLATLLGQVDDWEPKTLDG